VIIPRLIGMIHLDALPGAPRFSGSLQAVVERACRDATTLEQAGFDAVMIENFGDVPFFADNVPPVTLTSMTRVATEVAATIDIPFGVNVLRNDGLGALAVAAATGAAMIRVNVLSSMMYTDQGPIVGRAAELARLRQTVAPDVLVLADVFVKHASPPAGATIELAALDAWERSGADGLVISGSGTGAPIDVADLHAVATAVPDAPLVIGSGATTKTVQGLDRHASSFIVGSALKIDSDVARPIDAELARQFVQAASTT
jgi:hypothetical protein